MTNKHISPIFQQALAHISTVVKGSYPTPTKSAPADIAHLFFGPGKMAKGVTTEGDNYIVIGTYKGAMWICETLSREAPASYNVGGWLYSTVINAILRENPTLEYPSISQHIVPYMLRDFDSTDPTRSLSYRLWAIKNNTGIDVTNAPDKVTYHDNEIERDQQEVGVPEKDNDNQKEVAYLKQRVSAMEEMIREKNMENVSLQMELSERVNDNQLEAAMQENRGLTDMLAIRESVIEGMEKIILNQRDYIIVLQSKMKQKASPSPETHAAENAAILLKDRLADTQEIGRLTKLVELKDNTIAGMEKTRICQRDAFISLQQSLLETTDAAVLAEGLKKEVAALKDKLSDMGRLLETERGRITELAKHTLELSVSHVIEATRLQHKTETYLKKLSANIVSQENHSEHPQQLFEMFNVLYNGAKEEFASRYSAEDKSLSLYGADRKLPVGGVAKLTDTTDQKRMLVKMPAYHLVIELENRTEKGYAVSVYVYLRRSETVFPVHCENNVTAERLRDIQNVFSKC